MQTNVIKQNNFHVEEDFYEEIINGLQGYEEREQVRDKKQPVVILPKQARFITYVTTPVLLRQTKGLIETVTRYQYQQEKAQSIFGLRGKFMRAYEKFAGVNEDVEEELAEFDSRKFSLFGIVKVLKTFRTVARIYTAIKQYKKPKGIDLTVGLSQLDDPLYQQKFDSEWTYFLYAQKDALVPVFVEFLKPTAKQLFTMYDQKLEELYVAFWKFMFKTLVFDPTDWLDWTILALTIGGVILSSTGVGAGAGGAIMALGTALKGTKIAKGVYKIAKPLIKMAKIIKKIPGSKYAIRGTKWTAGKITGVSQLRKLNKIKPTGTFGKNGSINLFYKRFKVLNSRATAVRAAIHTWDLLDVTDEDVQDYREYLQRRGRVLRGRFEAVVSDDLVRMLEMGADIIDYADEKVKSNIAEIMAGSKNVDDKLEYQLKERYYGVKFDIKNFRKLTIIQKLIQINLKINLLWASILKKCDFYKLKILESDRLSKHWSTEKELQLTLKKPNQHWIEKCNIVRFIRNEKNGVVSVCEKAWHNVKKRATIQYSLTSTGNREVRLGRKIYPSGFEKISSNTGFLSGFKVKLQQSTGNLKMGTFGLKRTFFYNFIGDDALKYGDVKFNDDTGVLVFDSQKRSEEAARSITKIMKLENRQLKQDQVTETLTKKLLELLKESKPSTKLKEIINYVGDLIDDEEISDDIFYVGSMEEGHAKDLIYKSSELSDIYWYDRALSYTEQLLKTK